MTFPDLAAKKIQPSRPKPQLDANNKSIYIKVLMPKGSICFFAQ